MTIDELHALFQPLYAGKDVMHDFSHILRIGAKAEELAAQEAITLDHWVLWCGAHLHGFVYTDDCGLPELLLSRGVTTAVLDRAIAAAWESGRKATPHSPEGTVLHDAHLLEGGRPYLVTKSLITGTTRGQSLVETLNFMENEILGVFHCLLPSAQREYTHMEAYARKYLGEQKKALGL